MLSENKEGKPMKSVKILLFAIFIVLAAGYFVEGETLKAVIFVSIWIAIVGLLLPDKK